MVYNVDNGTFDRYKVSKPFADIVRSSDTSGLITGIALTSLLKFVENGLFGASRMHLDAAVT